MGQKDIVLLISVFNAIAAFNALFVIFLMVRDYRSNTPANRLLAFFLFSTALVNLMLFLIYTGIISRLPWLYRLPSPIYYMMFPAAWLYVRMIIRDEVRLKPRDGLHFIPGLLHLFEMLPYYLKSADYKVRHIIDDAPQILGAYMHNEGILPPYMHNLLRGIQGTIYGLLMLRIINLAFGKKGSYRSGFPEVKKWLTAFSVCVFVFGFSVMLTFIGTWASPAFRSLNLSFFIAVTQTVTALSLLTNPRLLFGMPRFSPAKPLEDAIAHIPAISTDSSPAIQEITFRQDRATRDQETDSLIEQATQTPDWVALQVPKLEAFLKQSDSFLKNRYTIRDMSVEVDIPQHHLSYLLNRVYNLRFNDFINSLRVEHIRKRVFKADSLKQMTLEGLAKEAGFTNRTTFIRVVQKLTGQNPSDYFSQEGNNKAIDLAGMRAQTTGKP
jgi:AraC-like DNA-binding protein